MPNAIAYGALVLWPFVTLALFVAMSPPRAIIWSLLAGYLFLPVKTSFDFPGVPALDKTSIANLSALVCALIFVGGRAARFPREWWLLVLMLVYLISPMLTVFTNRDALMFGELLLPGLQPYDAFSAAAYKAIDLIPFLLGYNLLRSSSSQQDLLQSLAISAIGYSILMLVEIRLSPQLHVWIYGFFPHSFGQQVRDGAFRPVVFLGHGLLVAIFTAMGVVATAYLARRKLPIFGISSWFWLAYLAIILVLCRSFGALILAASATVLIATVSRRQTVSSICAIVGLLVLTYPALRGADLVPVQAFADQVADVSAERAGSFQTRIDNEDQLLKRANDRPWFGWGGYGRNRIYNEDTGKDLSITDGTWIIIVGTYGWVGYIAAFGLLCAPLLNRSRQPISTTALSLILAVNLLDLLPNSSVGPMTWLLAGAIASGTTTSKPLHARTPENRNAVVT